MNPASFRESSTSDTLDVPRKFFMGTAILSLIFLGIAGFLFYQKFAFLLYSEKVIGQSYGKRIEEINYAPNCNYDSELAGYFADLSSFSVKRPSNLKTRNCARFVVFTTRLGQTVDKWVGDYTYVSKRREVEILYNPDNPDEFVPNEFRLVFGWAAYTAGLSVLFGTLAMCCLIPVKTVLNIGYVFESILGLR